MSREICITFPHKGTILRKAYARNAEGGRSHVESTIEEEVVCFVQASSNNEMSKEKSTEMHVTVDIFFKSEPNLKDDDIFLITHNSEGTSYLNQRFQFHAIDDATAGHGIAWKAMFSRQNNPIRPDVAN